MGRYVERAEDTARLLDVTYHNMLEAAPAEAAMGWGELLQVLFVDEAFTGDPADARAVTHFLVLDPDNPGSIRSSVRRARHNARGLRDRISTELWESMNSFYLELNARDVRAELSRQPYAVYRWVRNQCQLLSGVASETMPRDDGYRFLVLGRWLERAEMTCRLVAVRYKALGGTRELEFHWWAGLLSSVSAYEAYLKEHQAAMDPAHVLEFLLRLARLPPQRPVLPPRHRTATRRPHPGRPAGRGAAAAGPGPRRGRVLRCRGAARHRAG